MRDKELFVACTKQCVWCAEQWPVLATGGQMIHVGPYTKDKSLFFYPCKADSIREAFEYVGYGGGKINKWRTPPIEKLLGVKVMASPETRAFWRGLNTASLNVSEWPDWKRSIGGKKSTPEELKHMREELLYWDALDYWARKACTENLQYRPSIVNGRIAKPTCNWGLGCVTCWGRYDTYEKKLHEND